MAAASPASLEVRDLTFRYPGAADPALVDLAFDVAPGQRVGLLGPNGAGKTTLMRIVCGYLPVPAAKRGGRRPSLAVAGFDVARESLAVRQRVGYLPEQVPVYAELRVREHLDFRATVKRVPRRRRRAEIERVAELSGLKAMLETPIHKLSRGYRQRVGIADALLGSPPLVVLDEPTVGLDPNQVQGIRAMLRELGGAQTLIFSSHILAEVEALCDRILILSRGRLVADESVQEALDTHTVILEWPREHGETAGELCVAAAWSALGIRSAVVARVETSEAGFRARVVVDGGPTAPTAAAITEAIARAALARELPLLRLVPGSRRLEERFALATGFIEEGDA